MLSHLSVERPLTKSKHKLAAVLSLGLGATCVTACKKDDSVVVEEPSVAEAPSAKTPDRLPPGKLLEGTDRAFSFTFPQKMTVDAVFPDSVHAAGPVAISDLVDYVKDRVFVDHMEMADGRIIFPNVKIRGGDHRIVRIEILKRQNRPAQLILRDLTPPPAVEGLTEQERWERAGLSKSGQLIDQQNLE